MLVIYNICFWSWNYLIYALYVLLQIFQFILLDFYILVWKVCEVLGNFQRGNLCGWWFNIVNFPIFLSWNLYTFLKKLILFDIILKCLSAKTLIFLSIEQSHFAPIEIQILKIFLVAFTYIIFKFISAIITSYTPLIYYTVYLNIHHLVSSSLWHLSFFCFFYVLLRRYW